MAEAGRPRGFARHQHFGLRREWVELYLRHPDDWKVVGGLGNRQVQSLDVWLHTTGLRRQGTGETWLCQQFRERGTDDLSLWECLWANVVLGFPTAAWYARDLGTGEWTAAEMRHLLAQHAPWLAERTISNAVMELVGLLQRTPVGRELRQGEVFGKTGRRVRRLGLQSPSSEALRHSLDALARREGRRVFGLNEGLLWPWVIFACDRTDVLVSLDVYGAAFVRLTDTELRLLGSPEEAADAYIR